MSEKIITHRILVVEESATLRYMLGKAMQKQGYDVISADNFESAKDILKVNEKQLHAIVVGWPSYENFDECRYLLTILNREAHSQVPVILLSNDAEVELLNWMSARKSTALVPWENYREVVLSLQTMLNPDSSKPVIEKRKVYRNTKPVRVLFVDDSRSIRAYYNNLLKRNHYEVITTASVDEAYRIACTDKIDIAIIDYFMPEKNGSVLCQKLRDNPQTEGIRAAVITGTYMDAIIRECLHAGAVECMFKNEAEELFLARLSVMRRFIEVQRSIENQRESLAAILESVGEGVYGVNTEGRITFMNPAALSLLGLYDVKPLLGKSADYMFHPDAQNNGRDLLKESYYSGQKLNSWETVFRHQSGKDIPVDCTLHPLIVNKNREGSVIAFRDISERKMMEQKLRWQVTHDHLTGLYNRRFFENRVENEINMVKRTGIMSALVYLDLDRFKYINDTVGHEAGDRLLVDLSLVINKCLRQHDMAARLGGDEFGVLLKNADKKTAVKVANNIRRSIAKLRVSYKDKLYHVNASLGVAMMDLQGNSAGDVMVNADTACQISKQLGRNQTHLYQESSDARGAMGSELGWSVRIKEALKNNKFRLYYQPIMEMQDINLIDLPVQDGVLWERHLNGNGNGKVCNFEVLVRMIDDEGEIYFPDSFMPTAERFNMMTEIDMWVLENSLKEMSASSIPREDIRLSINVSGNTVDDDSSLVKIKSLISKYQINPTALTFEVTETCAIENVDLANDFINELRKIGCQFSLDDFGSGFCSFAQLKNLDTNYVKIDGQFVRNMARGATDRAIVTAMNDVAHSLGRHTVAEYVESSEIVRLLKICGVDKVQGNYISIPLQGLPNSNVVNFHSRRN